MKRSPSTQCLTSAQIESRLKRAGVQATAQRIAICRYVLCEADHPTAEQVKAWADENFPKISLATVYNTLGTLVEAELVREFKFSHSDKVVYDHNTSEHHHFLDEKTGRIYDIEKEHVKVSPQLPGRFKVHSVEVLLKGNKN